MRYEAWLLRELADNDLPFSLPVLLKANSGDIVVPCQDRQGCEALATLSPLLPGALHDLPAQRHDLLSAAYAAVALALLDRALAQLPDAPLLAGYTPLPSFGELASWQQQLPDPLAALKRLPADRLQVTQLQAFLHEVRELVPGLYATLPQQVLHRDYDPSNILQDQQRVTAVLDFEFAGRDIRVLELGVALSWWPVNLLGTGKEWDLIEVFGNAYTRQLALSEPELLALPAVFRLRDAVSLLHRMGRYFAGMETQARMQRRVEHSLWREAWLAVHQQTLLDYALAWK
jgi:Ser/Thr protein kinase RdoA (MazF antagonist)